MIRRTDRGIAVGYLPPPTEFGAPAKFKHWRMEQEEAAVLCSNSSRRSSWLQMPTGTGKSMFAVLFGMMEGKRTLIIAGENRGLEDQYDEDYRSCGVVDIRGMNNYRCPALEPGGAYSYLRGRGPATCDRGPCKMGMPCKLRGGGCPGYDQVAAARDARVVTTNYANWITIGRNKKEDEGDAIGEFDLIILDEVHAAESQVSKMLTVEVPLHEVEDIFGPSLPSAPDGEDIHDWLNWVSILNNLCVSSLQAARDEMKYARDGGNLSYGMMEDTRILRQLVRDIVLLQSIKKPDDWLVDIRRIGRGSTARFRIIEPAAYCEKYLFRGIKRVIGMSATLIPRTVEYLGFKKGTFDFWEWDSPFPIQNRPIYVLQGPFMRFDMSEEEKSRWVSMADRIAVNRDAGIIHTVSYDRARYYVDHSVAPERILHNLDEKTADVVDVFKNVGQKRRNKILVTPSVGTGYDFPDDTARWQLLPKVPFRDRRDKLVVERSKRDKRYPSYLAMTYIVQAVGRIVRHMMDWGETFITDGVFWRWYEVNRDFAPAYFRKAVKRIFTIPKGSRSRNLRRPKRF